MSGKMTRTERALHVGAELNLPGSGDHLVAVYRCAPDLRMAATIKVFLLDRATRSECLADMREQVEARKSSRRGPKQDRHAAALEALSALEALE